MRATIPSRSIVLSLFAAVVLVCASSSCWAQESKKPRRRRRPVPQQTQPVKPADTAPTEKETPAETPAKDTQQPSPASPSTPPITTPAVSSPAVVNTLLEPLEPSPFLVESNPQRWTLTADYDISATQFYTMIDKTPVPSHDQWTFDTVTFVFPVVPRSASSILEVFGHGEHQLPAVKGKVTFDGSTVASKAELITQGIGGGPLPSGTWRAQWKVPPPKKGSWTPRNIRFEVSTSLVSYDTTFDEKAASQIDWPTGPWPVEAQSTFEPQMFVEMDPTGKGYDMRPVKALLKKWTRGKDPKTLKPVVLAKYLAGQVVNHSQINGEGLAYDQTGAWQGFLTPGAANLARTGMGTKLDLPCLLVALYRQVGLPARLVIGYDNEGQPGEKIYLKAEGSDATWRVWAEFALYDEVNQTFSWIPVDVTAMRLQQSQLPRDYLNKPLNYFGTNDEFDHVAPIAFHFHPPTTVRAYGSPSLWGWFVTPAPPGRAAQRVKFTLTNTSTGGRNTSHLPEPIKDGSTSRSN